LEEWVIFICDGLAVFAPSFPNSVFFIFGAFSNSVGSLIFRSHEIIQEDISGSSGSMQKVIGT
jgi:hypothetical protein